MLLGTAFVPMCLYVHQCIDAVESRRGHLSLEWSHRVVVTCLMWVLETELGSSKRAATALTHAAVSLAPSCPFCSEGGVG